MLANNVILVLLFLSALQVTKILQFLLTFFSSLIAVIIRLCPKEGPITVFTIIIIIIIIIIITIFLK